MTSFTIGEPRRAAIRAGFSRGWIETRQSFTQTANLIGHGLPLVSYVAVLLMLRGRTVPGAEFALTTIVLPSLLSMAILFGGVSAPTTVLVADREDGTLLRAKATPNGMLGYLVGKIVTFTLTTLLAFVAILILGTTIVDGVILDVRAWLLLTLVFVLGMIATVPLGVALGSVMTSSLQAMLVPVACALLIYPSGIFYPLAALPGWLQAVGQAFPFYWIGLGARSAMLPPEMVAAELGQSWRTTEMFAVLGAWALVGLLLAPTLLRRMARRQSGSTLAATRARILSKGY